jgi:SAM-dependent methyltransferase
LLNESERNSQRDKLLQISERRLHPSRADPNFLVLRARRLNFSRWISQLPGQNLTVLDVGGRYQPYRPLLQDRTARYVGLDIVQTVLVDVVGSGECLPFAANTFDVVIATQVFEFLSQPRAAAQQIHTVLKPGGCLLMSVAGFTPRIVDEEMWRFTPQGIRFSLSPFSTIEIIAETFSPGGLVRAINLGLVSCSNIRFVKRTIELGIVPLLNLFGLGFENCKFTTNDQFAPNYSVLAVK